MIWRAMLNSQVTSCYIIPFCIRSRHALSYHVISCRVMLYHIMSHHVASWYIISCHIMLRHAIAYHVISCCAILYHIMSYHFLSCYVTWCFLRSLRDFSEQLFPKLQGLSCSAQQCSIVPPFLECELCNRPPFQLCAPIQPEISIFVGLTDWFTFLLSPIYPFSSKPWDVFV